MAAFEVLGHKMPGPSADRFLFYLVPDWPTPSFSPLLLLPGQGLDNADIKRIEELYTKVRNANPHVKDTPYLTLLRGESLYDLEALQRTLGEAGWQIEDKALSINVFRGPPHARLPEHHVAEVIEFSERGLPPQYCDLLRAGFGADEAYLLHVRGTFARATARTQIVLVRNAAGEVVSGGAASVRGNLGFLTWGTVTAACRDMGYHRVILNQCLSVAASAGAEIGILTTRNDRVRGRGHTMTELLICRKTA
jgi:hypothetical protein